MDLRIKQNETIILSSSRYKAERFSIPARTSQSALGWNYRRTIITPTHKILL